MNDHPPPPDLPNLPPDFAAALEAYSARERGRAYTPPPGFTDRVTATVARRRWVGRGAWAALAAVLVLTVGGYLAVRNTTRDVPAVKHEPVVPQPVAPLPPKLSESFSEAGEALASLSQDTMGKAVEPTKALFANADKFRLTPPKAMAADVQPAASTFERVPSAAKSSLEPLTTRTRKALTLFLRDTGLRSNP